jgi:hypothetical protein
MDKLAKMYKTVRDATYVKEISTAESIGVLTLILHELTTELNKKIKTK